MWTVRERWNKIKKKKMKEQEDACRKQEVWKDGNDEKEEDGHEDEGLSGKRPSVGWDVESFEMLSVRE